MGPISLVEIGFIYNKNMVGREVLLVELKTNLRVEIS